MLDPDEIQAIAARDQLWSSLRVLQPEIDALAEAQFTGTEREKQVIQVLARIVTAELQFRTENPKE